MRATTILPLVVLGLLALVGSAEHCQYEPLTIEPPPESRLARYQVFHEHPPLCFTSFNGEYPAIWPAVELPSDTYLRAQLEQKSCDTQIPGIHDNLMVRFEALSLGTPEQMVEHFRAELQKAGFEPQSDKKEAAVTTDDLKAMNTLGPLPGLSTAEYMQLVEESLEANAEWLSLMSPPEGRHSFFFKRENAGVIEVFSVRIEFDRDLDGYAYWRGSYRRFRFDAD